MESRKDCKWGIDEHPGSHWKDWKNIYNWQIIMESRKDIKWVIDGHSGISLDGLKDLL